MVSSWCCRAVRHVSASRQHAMFMVYRDSGTSSESLLRRALFEDTGGMYPELITRPDIKVFLPPIGNLTAYICMCLISRESCNIIVTSPFTVGNPAYLSDESKELTLRVHDEC